MAVLLPLVDGNQMMLLFKYKMSFKKTICIKHVQPDNTFAINSVVAYLVVVNIIIAHCLEWFKT